MGGVSVTVPSGFAVSSLMIVLLLAAGMGTFDKCLHRRADVFGKIWPRRYDLGEAGGEIAYTLSGIPGTRIGTITRSILVLLGTRLSGPALKRVRLGLRGDLFSAVGSVSQAFLSIRGLGVRVPYAPPLLPLTCQAFAESCDGQCVGHFVSLLCHPCSRFNTRRITAACFRERIGRELRPRFHRLVIGVVTVSDPRAVPDDHALLLRSEATLETLGCERRA